MCEKIRNYVYSMKDEIFQDLADLVAIPSVKGKAEEGAPFGEKPKKALLKMKEICDDMNFKTTVYGDAVLCADYAPDNAEIGLGILCHLDVVPVEKANWDTDPFMLTYKNGFLYGRGVIDDKGPAVAALWALNCVKELNVPLKKGVRLIFGTDEENGSEDLEIYKKYDKFPPNVFTPDGSFPVINIEKGMVRSGFSGSLDGSGNIASMSGGNIPNAVPDRACAEIFDSAESAENDTGECVSVLCRGKAAHASSPQAGVNAVTKLISYINKNSLASGRQAEILRGILKLFPHGETDGSSLGLKCSDSSGELTCVLSTFSMDRGKVSGTVDVRFPTCIELNTVKEKLKLSFASIGLDYKMILGDEPHIVSENSEFVQKLLSVYEKVEGQKGRCIAIGGGTYVHNIDGGVAFGAERGDTDYHMHGDNEFITAEELLKDTVLFANVISEVC